MCVCTPSDIKDSATECGVCVTMLSIHPHGKAGPKMEHHSRLDSEGWVVRDTVGGEVNCIVHVSVIMVCTLP